MKNAILSACLFFPACAAFGQTLTFEVASVRPSPPPASHSPVFYGPPRGGPGTQDPGRITWSNAALRAIIMAAYDVQTFQLIAPDWLSAARYDIVAKVTAGTTKEEVRIMWQNLLKDRFSLALHYESKELPVEEMTIARGGAKLKETEDPQIEPFTPDGSRKFDKNGAPEMNGSGAIVMITMNGNTPTARMVARGLTLPEIAAKLGQNLHRTVIDRTGLAGKYDFTLEFTPDLPAFPVPPGVPSAPAESASEPSANVAAAVEKQLGLKLTSAKEKLEVIVVDHAEKMPTEN
jgi:uncharacterized protein (TIGR03435 family)